MSASEKLKEPIINMYNFNEIAQFLHVHEGPHVDENEEICVRELCLKKLCESIGIKCKYNAKNPLLNFISTVAGEAVLNKLNIGGHIASDELRYVRFRSVNIVNTVREILDSSDVDDAFAEIFKFMDNFSFVIPSLDTI